MLASLAACGGGHDEAPAAPEAPAPTPAPTPAPPPLDPRSGSYRMYSGHGGTWGASGEFILQLDFDASTWRVTASGVDLAGTFHAVGDEYEFLPVASATDASARFTIASETVIGSFAFPVYGVQPFIAPRRFARTLAEAEGQYAFFFGARSSSTWPVGGEFGRAELRNGTLKATLPWVGTFTGPMTLVDDVYTWQMNKGSFDFRLALIGTERVLLRSGPFGPDGLNWYQGCIIGIHESAPFVAGNARLAVTGSDGSGWVDAAIGEQSLVFTPVEGRPLPVTRALKAVSGTPPVHEYQDTAGAHPEFTTTYAYRSNELAVVGEPMSQQTFYFFALGRPR